MKTILHAQYTLFMLSSKLHFDTMSDQVLQLKIRRKTSQVTEGTLGLQAASNQLWSGFWDLWWGQ